MTHSFICVTWLTHTCNVTYGSVILAHVDFGMVFARTRTVLVHVCYVIVIWLLWMSHTCITCMNESYMYVIPCVFSQIPLVWYDSVVVHVCLIHLRDTPSYVWYDLLWWGFICIHTCTYMYVYVYIYVHIYMYVYICVHIHMYIHVYIKLYLHVFVYTYMRTRIYQTYFTHMYIDIHHTFHTYQCTKFIYV